MQYGAMWEGYTPPTPGYVATCAQGHFRCLAACGRTDLHLDDVSIIDLAAGTALCDACRTRRARSMQEQEQTNGA